MLFDGLRRVLQYRDRPVEAGMACDSMMTSILGVEPVPQETQWIQRFGAMALGEPACVHLATISQLLA
jgi:hypothetical protein